MRKGSGRKPNEATECKRPKTESVIVKLYRSIPKIANLVSDQPSHTNEPPSIFWPDLTPTSPMHANPHPENSSYENPVG